MCGIFTYICITSAVNVGKQTIHGALGIGFNIGLLVLTYINHPDWYNPLRHWQGDQPMENSCHQRARTMALGKDSARRLPGLLLAPVPGETLGPH